MAVQSVLVAVLGVASPAHAQTFTYQTAAVLEPDSGITWASESVGSPSVAYDTIHDRFLMAFESRTPTEDADCPQGVWALGLATSADGINWTIETTAMVEPTPSSGNYYSCVAAHPAAVFRAVNDGELYVLFKAEQAESSCAGAACPYTGIGGVRLTFNAAGNVSLRTITASPVLTLNGPGGHPSFVQDSGTFRMLYQEYPDIYRTSSTNINSFPAGTLTFDASYDWLGLEGVSWEYDEFKSPSVLCDDSVAFPFAAWVGSVDTSFGAVLEGAWGKAISTVGVTWDLATSPSETWSNDDDWRHWDMLRLVTGDYLVWFSERDVSGDSSIYFGGTSLVFNNSDVESRICP